MCEYYYYYSSSGTFKLLLCHGACSIHWQRSGNFKLKFKLSTPSQSRAGRGVRVGGGLAVINLNFNLKFKLSLVKLAEVNLKVAGTDLKVD